MVPGLPCPTLLNGLADYTVQESVYRGCRRWDEVELECGTMARLGRLRVVRRQRHPGIWVGPPASTTSMPITTNIFSIHVYILPLLLSVFTPQYGVLRTMLRRIGKRLCRETRSCAAPLWSLLFQDTATAAYSTVHTVRPQAQCARLTHTSALFCISQIHPLHLICIHVMHLVLRRKLASRVRSTEYICMRSSISSSPCCAQNPLVFIIIFFFCHFLEFFCIRPCFIVRLWSNYICTRSAYPHM